MVNPEKRNEFVQTIRRLVGATRGIKGCRTFGFYLDAGDENSSLLISEWETESDLERYLRSNDSAILRGAIRVLSVRSIDSKALVTSHVSQP
jgi:quinol monooxygenase YgiN